MRRVLRVLHNERGQVLMMTVLVLSVMFVIGVIVVDFGLWFSERRGAQKDADLSALAAAQPLMALSNCPDLALQTQANDRGWEYAQYNGVTDHDNAHLPDLGDCAVWTACWADEGDTSSTIDSYPLDIEHPSRGLFATIFDMWAPEGLGAHARACVGSIVGMYNLMPIGVPVKDPDVHPDPGRELCYVPDDSLPGTDDDDPDDLPEPLFGKRCDLSVFDKDSGEAGWLDLDNPSGDPSLDCSVRGGGANELGEEIEQGGANTYCKVAPRGFLQPDCTDDMNWCVESKTGGQPVQIMEAFHNLTSTEGDCDVTGDGMDDFDGTVHLEYGTPETDSAFYKEICDSPRLITLIIIDNFTTSGGNPLMPIRAFAGFFVEACYVDGVEYPTCNKDDMPGEIGHASLVGRFVNIVGEGEVGWPTDWSPKRVILDE
jgi:hypothetical protein